MLVPKLEILISSLPNGTVKVHYRLTILKSAVAIALLLKKLNYFYIFAYKDLLSANKAANINRDCRVTLVTEKKVY